MCVVKRFSISRDWSKHLDVHGRVCRVPTDFRPREMQRTYASDALALLGTDALDPSTLILPQDLQKTSKNSKHFVNDLLEANNTSCKGKDLLGHLRGEAMFCPSMQSTWYIHT